MSHASSMHVSAVTPARTSSPKNAHMNDVMDAQLMNDHDIADVEVHFKGSQQELGDSIAIGHDVSFKDSSVQIRFKDSRLVCAERNNQQHATAAIKDAPAHDRLVLTGQNAQCQAAVATAALCADQGAHSMQQQQRQQ